ncbi:hypothetical protein B0P06_003834 [Clostridium saccharoperbutylacetonicum]|uniref:Uncharacterized protein n=1 Tax=Clostridium saccharoperbutylacetonicum N1-4(HMT) TaxID=931276 RepID=M1N342_9CLOT|nr:hypothetical protein [Clostridium saccharoperbutylacetonicum]AGF57857.1 hypothetical protein Cspa_c41040 [Clostridium saccharoperbutylacetonicum N1-4(HMT)]NRT61371.1 hypothetical protein [Clostridium saccharoperbutylacetonicum]NSB24689.1 hypothetical protein [Clostridium saccharoperbutylacetonicum]NSB44063.1 hypothetical protein [Clostridium saccharoperbutylacetonicum]
MKKSTSKLTKTKIILYIFIVITFFNPASTNFKVGENINVKYLPHSHMGISYSYINESVPFSLLPQI